MKIKAELKKTSQRKSASTDNVYQIVFETDDNTVMDLGKFPSDTIFDVKVEAEDAK